MFTYYQKMAIAVKIKSPVSSTGLQSKINPRGVLLPLGGTGFQPVPRRIIDIAGTPPNTYFILNICLSARGAPAGGTHAAELTHGARLPYRP